jgi:hypothetical protein
LAGSKRKKKSKDNEYKSIIKNEIEKQMKIEPEMETEKNVKIK